MAARRAVTEAVFYDDEDEEQLDINELDDDQLEDSMDKAYEGGLG